MNVQELNKKENKMLHRVLHHISPKSFEEKLGEGTKWDLDYGKLTILFLCIYIAVQVS